MKNRGLELASSSLGLVFPQGGTTGPMSGGLVFPDGEIADPNVRRDYRRVGTVGLCHFFGAVRAHSPVFSPTSKEDPRG